MAAFKDDFRTSVVISSLIDLIHYMNTQFDKVIHSLSNVLVTMKKLLSLLSQESLSFWGSNQVGLFINQTCSVTEA